MEDLLLSEASQAVKERLCMSPLIYTDCPHSITETDGLKDVQTQEVNVNARCGVCGGVGPREGHSEERYKAKH